MKYYISNEKGQRIAEYDHASQVKEFVKASYPGFDPESLAYDRAIRNEVKDKDGKLLGTIEAVELP